MDKPLIEVYKMFKEFLMWDVIHIRKYKDRDLEIEQGVEDR